MPAQGQASRGQGKVKIRIFFKQHFCLSVVSAGGIDFIVETAEMCTFAGFTDSYVPFLVVFVPGNSFVF
jgi:hypothetical protein